MSPKRKSVCSNLITDLKIWIKINLDIGIGAFYRDFRIGDFEKGQEKSRILNGFLGFHG